MSSFQAGPPFSATAPPSSTAFPGGGGGGGGNGGGGESSSSNTNLANSASLYLYTFLATLVLLLSVSGAIVVRSFILRRRHRRMVEEAIRNGTWIPPTPAARAARVDLSKKPELWEAYLGGGGSWQLGSFGHGSGKEFEYSRDWESIKPVYAGYSEPLTSVPYSGSTPNLTSLASPVFIPTPTPTNHSASRGDHEENRRTAEVSSGAPRSLLSRARIFLNSSTVPAASSADNGTNSRSNSANISMTELNSNSPSTIRVAVLIAMPSPSSHGSSTPLSASLSSSKSQPSSSHPLELSPSPTTLRSTDDEEQPLPHLEMGVADVVMGRSENSPTWVSTHTRREEKTSYSRGSSYAEP